MSPTHLGDHLCCLPRSYTHIAVGGVGALAGPCKQLQGSLAGQAENVTFLCSEAELTLKCQKNFK